MFKLNPLANGSYRHMSSWKRPDRSPPITAAHALSDKSESRISINRPLLFALDFLTNNREW